MTWHKNHQGSRSRHRSPRDSWTFKQHAIKPNLEDARRIEALWASYKIPISDVRSPSMDFQNATESVFLSPDGEFYGVHGHGHGYMAEQAGVSYARLGKAGFIRVHTDGSFYLSIELMTAPTRAQWEALEDFEIRFQTAPNKFDHQETVIEAHAPGFVGAESADKELGSVFYGPDWRVQNFDSVEALRRGR